MTEELIRAACEAANCKYPDMEAMANFKREVTPSAVIGLLDGLRHAKGMAAINDARANGAAETIQHLRDDIAELRAQLPSQGGEAVAVVAYIDGGGAIHTARLLEIMSVEPYGCEPLMTVAQHQRMMLALVARCYQEGAFKTCLECGYQDGHDQICQYHESKRAAASDDLTNVRCLCCQSEHAHNSYDAGFIAGSGMCQACDAAMPAKDLPAVSAEPVEWQHQAPDGSWWGIAKSRVDEARLAGRPIRPLYTHPAGQVARPDAELVRQCIAQELATWEGDFKGPVHTAMRCLQVRIDAKMATLK